METPAGRGEAEFVAGTEPVSLFIYSAGRHRHSARSAEQRCRILVDWGHDAASSYRTAGRCCRRSLRGAAGVQQEPTLLIRDGPVGSAAQRSACAARCRRCSSRRRQLDNAGQELRVDTFFRAQPDHAGERRKLALAFTFSTATTKGYEAPPLVVNGTMYLITPYPNILYALDLTKPGAPAKWVFKPKPAAASQGVACCDVVNRGAVYDNGRIFFNTLDGQTIAVDASSGQQVWRTQLGDIQKGETITMAPLVANGKVLVGNSGGEMGVRGWIAALDEGSGKVAWKAFNTGPDKDVLIGSEFKPFYAMDQGKDLGVKTWPPDAWKIGGGNVWGWISYDPETKMIFYGSGNPGPWNPEQRPGRQQMDHRGVRPRRRYRRSGVVLSVDAARSVRPRRHQRDHPRRHPVGQRPAPGHAAPGARRLFLRPGPPHRTGAVGDAVRPCERLSRSRSQDRDDGPEPRQGPQAGPGHARHLSGISRA